jgi:hypothetical protein
MIAIQRAPEWFQLFFFSIPTSRLRSIDTRRRAVIGRAREMASWTSPTRKTEASEAADTEVGYASDNLVLLCFFLSKIQIQRPKRRLSETSSRDDSKLVLEISVDTARRNRRLYTLCESMSHHFRPEVPSIVEYLVEVPPAVNSSYVKRREDPASKQAPWRECRVLSPGLCNK